MSDLWDEILEHHESPRYYGKVQGFTHRGSVTHKSCADTVSIQMRVENGIIQDAKFEGDGCVVSQASASMLLEHVQHKPLAEVQAITAAQWLEKFKSVVTPRKRQCVLLAIEALEATVRIYS